MSTSNPPGLKASVPLGIIGAIACIMAGIGLGSPLLGFFDSISALFTGLSTFLLLMYTYGIQNLRSHLIGGWSRMLRPNQAPSWYDTDHAKAARIGKSAIAYAVLGGMSGTLIGCVMMLQNMSDPRAIGPALGVAMLTPLYGVLLAALFFGPLVRFHAGEARGLASKERDEPLTYTVAIAALAWMGCLFSFFVMLLAFADFGSGQ